MVYETGYAANEFDLQQKLNAFILSVDGWTKISQPDVFDSVYFSSGRYGVREIYVRTVGGLSENPAVHPGNQRDFGDGYVGFLNFFVYQYFPEDGDGYDGYGEAGKIGPFLFMMRSPGDYDVQVQRFATAQLSSSNKWNRLSRTYDRSDGGTIEYYQNPMYYNDAAFDGKRYIYFWTDNSGFYRFDLASEKVDVLIKRVEGTTDFCALCCYIDPVTRKDYVWYLKDDGRSNNLRADGEWDSISQADQLQRWNVDAGVLEMGFSGPPWSNFGNREGIRGNMIWDGHNNLYAFRGNNTNEWAKYHIPTDTWALLVAMPTYTGTNSSFVESMKWLDKKTSGFDHHRIYWAANYNNTIYYIDIDENSGMPVGSWTSAGATPESPTAGHSVFHNNVNRWYYYAGQTRRSLYYASLFDSGTISWSLADTNYFPSYSYSYAANQTIAYIDGYGSRVRTSLRERTQYWFIGDEDRIIVITKADDKYSFCYMGGIEQFASRTPQALTTSPVWGGSDVEIMVDLLSGEFEVGQRLSIADITDENSGPGEIKGPVENIKRKFKSIEIVTITDVNPGVSITVSEVTNNYPTGSRIAYDPQPVGITLDGLDKIQMLNSINTVNTSGAFDMAENIAHLDTVREEIVNASGGDARRNSYALWPILILNDDTMAAYSGEEARGSLIGVFAASSQADLADGDTISVGTNTFMVFDVPTTKSFYYVFGPVNN